MDTVGVLAQVVASRGLQPEPVATDALTHVLSSSPAAGAALTALVSTITGDGSLSGLRYSTQVVSAGAEGRPDLVGADASGPRLICEAKFDAQLTAAQTGPAYLARLAPDQHGLLLFLVPEARIEALWPKLLAGPGGGAGPGTGGSSLDVPGVRSAVLPGGRTLAIISWWRLLEVLGQAVELAGDLRARGDLEQLAGLVTWRSRNGWLPVQPGDLPDTAGRQLAGIGQVLLSAASFASAAKVRNGSGDNGPGRWLKTAGGRWFWAGVWLKGWDQWGHGPLWATVSAQSEASYVAITEALAVLDHGDGPRRVSTGPKSWGIPLQIPPGVEREEAHASIVTQLQAFATLIDTAAIGAATEEPPVPPEEALTT